MNMTTQLDFAANTVITGWAHQQLASLCETPAHTVVSTGASHMMYFGPSVGLPDLEDRTPPTQEKHQGTKHKYCPAYMSLGQHPCQPTQDDGMPDGPHLDT